jgi:hypothetical protein
MASARKKFKAKKADAFEPQAIYGAFIKDLQSGAIDATRLHEGRDNRGNLELEYDDPNGNGGGGGQGK